MNHISEEINDDVNTAWFNELNYAKDTSTEIDKTQPWSKKLDMEAPEEDDTPLPVQFGDALTFLGKPRDVAIKEYMEMLEQHVSKDFKEQTDIMSLLKSEKALRVFVPD